MTSNVLGRAAVLVGLLVLTGCSVFSDAFDYVTEDTAKTKLTGERVSVLGLDRPPEPDPALAKTEVRLPRPVTNSEWPEAGGFPNHSMQHLALSGRPKEIWSTSIGDGASRYGRVLSQPVVAEGRIFGMDARDVVVALDANTGKRLWENDLKPEAEQEHAFGGGVAFAGNRLFAATGYGQVVALDAATGHEIWRTQLAAPLRGAPTVADARVFVVTVENQLEVLSVDDGHRLWSHNGIPETADLLGTASPAVEGDIVVVPYTSGEIFALRAENGRAVWTESLSASRSLGALATLADIRGRPVIDRGRVYVVGHSGRMLSIDLRTGDRVWEQELGGTNGAWIAGDYVYVLGNDVDLVCLTRQDGHIRWIRELPRYEDEKRKKDAVRWSGPVVAGDRVIVISSTGEAFSVSPYTGAPLGRVEFPEGVFVDPIVANDTLYVLTEDANLIALR